MIQDYSTLQQAIADWLDRSDLSANIPTFIQLAEARINRDLRVSQMLVQVEGTISDDLVLPSSALQIASFRVKRFGCWVELPPLPQSAIADMANCGGVFPWGYVVGPDDTLDQSGNEYQIAYYEAVQPLGDAHPQNWLILREPGLYLYAALCESAPFLRDDTRIPVWEGAYNRALDGMRAADGLARYGVAPAVYTGGFNAP